MLWWPDTNPSKNGLVPNAIFRICTESLEHNCGNTNISPTICTNMLILGKGTFLVLISQMILTNPIGSQILTFVTSHFTTLLGTMLVEKRKSLMSLVFGYYRYILWKKITEYFKVSFCVSRTWAGWWGLHTLAAKRIGSYGFSYLLRI